MLEPYEIEADPPSPDLPGRVVVRSLVEDLMSAVAADVFAQAVACVRSFGDFHLAVSGCPSVEPLYTRLMIDPLYRSLPWNKTHLWVVSDGPGGDGRFAGAEMLGELFGGHADIPGDQLHLLSSGDAEAATEYEARLRAALEWREAGHDRLDCVVLSPTDYNSLLGAPESGGLAAAHPTGSGVMLTRRFVRAARFVGVVGVGADHAEALRELAQPTETDMQPIGGELRWFLDGPAVGEPVH